MTVFFFFNRDDFNQWMELGYHPIRSEVISYQACRGFELRKQLVN